MYLTFDQSEYPSVDDALELVHIKIADNPLPICIQTNWTTQIENARECYNFTIDEEDDPRNINIPKSKRSHAVVGPIIDYLEITKKLNIKKINIGIEETTG